MASPFVSHEKSDVDHFYKAEHITFVLSLTGFPTPIWTSSLCLGNFAMRASVSPMLSSLLQLHLTSPASQAPRLPTPPAPWQSVCHFDRDNSKRSRDISAESKASHRTNIAETTTNTTNNTSHHVKQSRRRPGHSIPVGMLLHTHLHSISEGGGR
jgi:hypothetical protein